MEDNKKVIDIGKQLKKEERKRKFEEMKAKAKDWWDENKGYVAIVVPVVGAVLGKGIKAMSQHHNLKMEERNKDMRLYDTSLGHYWELKRKLRNDDWVQINRRRNRGESLGDILDEMRVLK